jgi:hypothetical protein
VHIFKCLRLAASTYITVNPITHNDTTKLVDSSGRVIGPSQRPLPDSTQHSLKRNIRAPGGIQTRNPCKLTSPETSRKNCSINSPRILRIFLRCLRCCCKCANTSKRPALSVITMQGCLERYLLSAIGKTSWQLTHCITLTNLLQVSNFLALVSKLWKAAIGLVVSVCLSVCLSVRPSVRPPASL